MDQINIGKFISDNRKKNNLTQQDLAKKLNVTDKAISKWENGRCLPDISVMPNLCSELNVTLNELLSGKKNNKSEDEVYKYIKEEKKNIIKKFLFILLIIILICIISILGIYFYNNYKQINAYELSGNSDNFSYSSGLIIKSNSKYIFNSGSLTTNNSDIKIISSSIKVSDNLIMSGTQIFNKTYEENYGYNELFKSNYFDDLTNWYIEIDYSNNGEVKKETLSINFDKIFSNDKFISIPDDDISSDNSEKRVLDDDVSELRKCLIEKGFSISSESVNALIRESNSIKETYLLGPQRYVYYDEDTRGIYSQLRGGENVIVTTKDDDCTYVYYLYSGEINTDVMVGERKKKCTRIDYARDLAKSIIEYYDNTVGCVDPKY